MVVKKEIVKEKSINLPAQKKDDEMQKILIENFVSLQKVMTNFAMKFDSLSTQISKLLELFEISAKTMSEKGFAMGEDKKILDKLDSLLDHNKVIAKGIALLHEKDIPEEQEVAIIPSQPAPKAFPSQNQIPSRPETKFPRQTQMESPKPRFTSE